MAKRGSSGLSRLIALNKPVGMSSHDVVNACRRIFAERRVGHMGTLDPLASGVLLVGIGPATRLDAYMAGQDKRYRMAIKFGTATTTDDVEGAVIQTLPIPPQLFSERYARSVVANLVGRGMQVPPVYSAIKVNGQKSYDAARKGTIIDLKPREYEVFDAQLHQVCEGAHVNQSPTLEWVIDMSVSKGTYMRSIARDLGRNLKTAAHVSSLQRLTAGSVSLGECVTLDQLEQDPSSGMIDPIRVLGLRYAFAREAAALIEHGAAVPGGDLILNEPLARDMFDACCCTTSVFPSSDPPADGEVVAVVADNRLQALYEYQKPQHRYVARCVFSIGVERGTGL